MLSPLPLGRVVLVEPRFDLTVMPDTDPVDSDKGVLQPPDPSFSGFTRGRYYVGSGGEQQGDGIYIDLRTVVLLRRQCDNAATSRSNV